MGERGETGPISPPLAISMTLSALFGMACLNCVEIFILAIHTFKKYTGLYFWSILIANTGTLFFAIANILRLFGLVANFPISVALVLNWWVMVTGQSVVLYSRLHLVTSNRQTIRWVLAMIVTNFFIIHIPVTIVWLGCQLDPGRFLHLFNVWERVQLSVFTLQEFIISGIYIWEAGHSLKVILANRGQEGQNVIRQLVLINSLVILFDISLCITEFTGYLYVQTTYQPFIYSLKLKMEFIILNKLIDIIHRPRYSEAYWQFLRTYTASTAGQTRSGQTTNYQFSREDMNGP
ncbi:hypothetical protein VFPPC_05378 [Pochonia chlamydosporia 170]|uniref:DUF7703 domain-containing protein n=1 Tax=Pochonia chlamydosporia 170 TaxID=1380566 RepID=A0A179FFM0_METCM|nr:hypothetical protein VFPPC_05378 [Pochonia chlamydosporia 170]OAQ64031.1 hypothetical protein VFPPC_05378 [Pochonia chlamydosporia 170]